MERTNIVTIRTFCPEAVSDVVDHLDEISVEELQDFSTTGRKEADTTAFSAIAYKNGVTQTELAEWHDVQRRTIYTGSTDSTPTSRFSRLLLMLIDLGERESSQKMIKKNSRKPFTNHLKKLGSIHRRLSSNILLKPTISSIQSRVAGGCSKKRN